jgi:hypothetical protein
VRQINTGGHELPCLRSAVLNTILATGYTLECEGPRDILQQMRLSKSDPCVIWVIFNPLVYLDEAGINANAFGRRGCWNGVAVAIVEPNFAYGQEQG